MKVHLHRGWQRSCAVMCALLLLAACAGGQPAGPLDPASDSLGQVIGVAERGAVPVAGSPAPEITFELDGREQRLSELRGRPVLINFWATWCGPCALEMPDLDRLAAEGAVVVLGINLKETAGPIAAFAAERGLSFPLLVDEQGLAASSYGVVNLPTSFFIDSTGIIAERRLGALTESQLRQRIEALE